MLPLNPYKMFFNSLQIQSNIISSANSTSLPHLQDRIDFYHVTLLFPVISTWTKAIKVGLLYLWPKLTAK